MLRSKDLLNLNFFCYSYVPSWYYIFLQYGSLYSLYSLVMGLQAGIHTGRKLYPGIEVVKRYHEEIGIPRATRLVQPG